MIVDNGENMYSKMVDIIPELCIINEFDIKCIAFSKAERENMEFCNLSKNDLIGKYYDNLGNIFQRVDNKYYIFNLRISKIRNRTTAST